MKNSNPDDTKKYASMRIWKKRWYRITSFLAAVVVFCTTYALILPAVTQERAVAQDSGVSVRGITISKITDGTAPFDGKPTGSLYDPGNDENDGNKIVRTFDKLSYDFMVETASQKIYTDARVKLEFILPLTKDQAEFDVAAMGWMDTTDGYTYKYQENQTCTIGNNTYTNCQVFTCYKHLVLTPGATSVIPGAFTNNLTINVKSMKNGDKITPIIIATPELNANGGYTLTMTKDDTNAVTVSAAPRYNVKLKGGPSYKDTFDFTTGNDTAQNKTAGSVVGRAMKFGVTLQLYNDGNNKGFKGIELPTGDITFDLKLTSKYGAAETETTDVTTNYTPLLWSCDYNSISRTNKKNSDGRDLTKDFSGSAYEYAPWTSEPGVWHGDDKTCYHGGGWSAKQTGDTISVTVFNYAINVNEMPTKNGDGGSVLYNPANGEGCFSSGEIWIVQPFNTIGSTTNSGYDIQTDFKDGTFYTTVEVQNVQAKSIGSGGNKVDDDAAQMKKDDDKETVTLPLYSEGNVTNRIAYRKDATSDEGVGVNNPYDGKDFATPGTSFYIYSGIDYTDSGEPVNQLYWATNFTRINADIFEVTDKPTIICKQDDKVVSSEKYTVLYVGDINNWGDEEALQSATEDGRQYYTSLDQLKNDKKKCIGVLYCVKGPLTGSVSFIARLPVKVRGDLTADKIGKAYMTVSTSRAWTKKMYEKDGKSESNIPALDIWTNNGTTLDNSFPLGRYQHANIKNVDWGWYKKEIYPEDGSPSEPHNSEWNWYGDTLLVIKFKSKINKTLLQKLPDKPNTAKDTFNLDANQRIVDFELQPATKYDNHQTSNIDNVTTLTIVDTLPKGLNYVENSAYIGGTYKQTSVNGGEQGEFTGGTKITLSSGGTPTEPSNVGDATLFKKVDAAGTTTLTWKVRCKIGEPVKPIYYSVEIGDRYNASNDIPVGTTKLPYNVRIYAAGEDLRAPNAANGNRADGSISAVRGSAYSFGKYTTNETVEPNGNIEYKIYYDNISTAETQVKLVDVMPANGVNGSQFSGNYTVESFKFDTNKCEISKLKLYYTNVETYRDNSAVDYDAISESNDWESAQISPTDGTVAAMNGKTPVAFAVLGTLDAEKSVNIDLTIKLNDPSTPKFTYVDFDGATANYYSDNSEYRAYLGAYFVDSGDGHGKVVEFTQMSDRSNQWPQAIAVSSYDGIGRFKVKKGETYTISFDYRNIEVDDDLQIAAIFVDENVNANGGGSVEGAEAQGKFAWLCWAWRDNKDWTSYTNTFEAPCDGTILLAPYTWIGYNIINQKIWLDNIKIEEIQDNKYINTVISGSGANSTTQQTKASTPIIRRSIEGLTWLDRDSDGVQNDGYNRYISGVKVSLLKLKYGFDPTNEASYESYCYPGTTKQVTVETGKQVSVISQGSATDYTDYISGRYRFMDLPEGIYAVKFEDGTGETKISPLIASPANRGEDDTLDSDGIAVYTNDRSALEYTLIKGIVMPAAADGYTYESKCNDSGFYERGYELPKSGGKGTDAYTFLGLTIWGFAFLAFVYRKARKTFGKSK